MHTGYSLACTVCGYAKNVTFIGANGDELMSAADCRSRLLNWEAACTGDASDHKKEGKKLLIDFAF